MLMKVTETIQTIQSLTLDEDEQQELWVRCLETGDDVDTLSKHLDQIRKEFSEERLLAVTLWKQVNTDKDHKLLDLFNYFTDLEQSVMRLLILGVSLQEISGITRISMVRLRHIVAIIREQEVWGTINGT